MSDDVTITVRVDDRTVAGFRDVDGRLRTLDGRFAATAGSMQRSGGVLSKTMVDIKASLLSLAPAAVPVAASLAPIAVQSGAAGLALASFGVAVKGQISNLGDAAKAQEKYADAVRDYGAGSKQAIKAGQENARLLRSMPDATARAAVSLATLRKQTSDWSDAMASFTMAPVEKSFVVLGALLPKLSPMVEGTSTQLDRLMKVAGGGINTNAFDGLAAKVADFSNNALKSATDRAIHFARVLSEGNAHGPIASFFDYARAQGPAVKDLLTNLTEALSNVLEGAAQAGPGMLTLVNAFAKLVAALPPSLIGNLMSIYAAFKLIKLAGAGIGAIGGQFAALSTRITAMRAAAVAAGGGIAGMNAALGTLSTGGKAALALGVVGGLALAMHKLSDNKAPVAVDDLATSLNTLGSTGKVTGTLSANWDEMTKSIAMMSKGASDNKFLQMASDFGTWVGIAKGPSISDATKNLDAWDKVMANNVRSGNTKLAAAQFEALKRGWRGAHGDMGRLKSLTNDYNNALADQKFEQQAAAASMGLFGNAAQAAQAKLDKQKSSADGLRQSIMALNEAHRSAFDAETKFAAAEDALTKGLKENGKTLDIHSEKGRANRDLMSQMAAATEENAAQAKENGASWSKVMSIYDEGRASIVNAAMAITGNRKEAEKLADTLMRFDGKDRTAMIKGDIKDLESKLSTARKKLADAPSSKTAHIKGEIRDLQKKVAAAKAALAGIKGRSVTVQVNTAGIGAAQAAIAALGGIPRFAGGGRVRRYADGGDVQMEPTGLIRGPGTGTSDSIFAKFASGAVGLVSNTEFVVNAEDTKKHLPLLQAINSGKLPRFAKGGVTKAEAAARKEAMSQLTISHFGHMAGYQRSEIASGLGKPADIGSLVNALNEWRHNIQKATHGRTESRLLKQLDSAGRSLLKWEKQLNSVTKALDSAKSKLADLKNSAAQLSDSVRGGVLSSANITRGASGDAPVTVASLMASSTAGRDKAKSFADALKALQKKGLDKGLIEDIAQAGIEGGGLETAGALLGASSSEIKSLNSLRSQTATYAKQAGGTAADTVYGAQIKAQERSVQLLTRSQDKLKTSMDKLAKSIEKSIEKAFGKKAAGGIVGAAASGGIRSGLTWVGEHGPELADLPVGSRVWSNPDSRRKAAAPWASMLNTPRTGGVRRGAVPVGGGSSQPIVVHQTIELDGRVVARQIFDPLRNEIRARGGSVQKTLGQGGG